MATNYTFSQPIRYYKANDPYYYEVDNIPLRQLEENILYVKEVLEGGLGGSVAEGGGDNPQSGSGENSQGLLTGNSEISLAMIKQLRPKVVGGRTVQVNAGVYNSRINDAYNISHPLSQIVFAGTSTPTTVIPALKNLWTSTMQETVWNNFTTISTAAKAYNVNGLEFAYTFYNSPGGVGGNWGVSTAANPPVGEGSGNYPKYAGGNIPSNQWPGYSSFGPLYSQEPLGPGSEATSFETLPDIHMAFVRMWRGVFRTAVVDFPESTIEIPAWSDADFYYEDEVGTSATIDADQRIDLLVAYSMPIDTSSTTLQDYQSGFCQGGGSPKTITTPVLGLIRGAGVGIKRNIDTLNTLEGCGRWGRAGSSRMLASESDSEAGANIGITSRTNVKVHGSFPSPDDLLNIAPLLALDVASDDFQLVGQTALPIAYVVVKKNQPVILQQDIIDIRPFLRTTELTYNERAGVAGANPPLSLANPAVGAYQLQSIVTSLEVQHGAAVGAATEEARDGKALYTDYVMGGLAYGVEGTLLTMCDGSQDNEDPFGAVNAGTTYTDTSGVSYDFAPFTSSRNFLDSTDLTLREAFLQYIYINKQTELKRWLSNPNLPFSQNTSTYLGLPQIDGRNIPLFPEWDMPMNGTNYLNIMTGGTNIMSPKVTWWMWFEAMNENRPFAYVPGGVISTNTANNTANLNKEYRWGTGDTKLDASVNIVSKNVEITFPSWCLDYDVLVEYVNCSPTTAAMELPVTAIGTGGGLYVNKGPLVQTQAGVNKAIIQINSIADNQTADDNGNLKDKEGGSLASPNSPDKNYQFLSYSVALPQFRANQWGTSLQNQPPSNNMRFVPKFGAAYYPTVKFTIIGYTNLPVLRNTAYTSANGNFTLLQGVTQGAIDDILAPIAPLMSDSVGGNITSRVDISQL